VFRSIGLAIVLALSVAAQEKQPESDRSADALVHWSADCMDKGCILSTDVLRGESGNGAADPKNDHEYVSVGVAVNRSDHSVANVSFQVDPDADQPQGIFLEFSKTEREGNGWKIHLKSETLRQLQFGNCNRNSCRSVVRNGIIPANDKQPALDLVQQLKESNHLFVLYTRDGKSYRTAILLSGFKEAFEHMLATELKSQ